MGGEELVLLGKRKEGRCEDGYLPRGSSWLSHSEVTALVAEQQKLPTLDGAMSMTSSVEVSSALPNQGPGYLVEENETNFLHKKYIPSIFSKSSSGNVLFQLHLRS